MQLNSSLRQCICHERSLELGASFMSPTLIGTWRLCLTPDMTRIEYRDRGERDILETMIRVNRGWRLRTWPSYLIIC